MGSLLLNDIIVTLFCSGIRFDRDVYERLCAELYDFYDTQSRGNNSYRFSNQRGGSCLIDNRHIRLTEFFSGQTPAAVVKPLAAVAESVFKIFHHGPISSFDVQISARLAQKELDSSSRVNFLSSEEYIAARFLSDVDYGPLGATPTGVGLRFLFKRNKSSYDLRVEPYFKDRTYLFLDLGIQRSDDTEACKLLEVTLTKDIDFFEENVVDFIRWHEDKEPIKIVEPGE